MPPTVDQPLGGTLAAAFAYPTPPRARRGILIATDGRPAADAAVIIGSAIARRNGEPFELLAVEPFDQKDEDRRSSGVGRHETHVRLAQQRARTTDLSHGAWPLSIAYGITAPTIADVADHGRRRLIVLGLHVHSRMDQLLRRDTAPRVVQHASCPVLTVDSNRRTIPRRVIIATDFSPSSITAARQAVHLIGDSGIVYLAHVTSRATVPFDARSIAEFELDVPEMLSQLRANLFGSSGIEWRQAILAGDPVHELLAFADQEGADLIACGTRGFGPIRGAVVGRTPTELLRAAKCSVLVVPPLAR